MYTFSICICLNKNFLTYIYIYISISYLKSGHVKNLAQALKGLIEWNFLPNLHDVVLFSVDHFRDRRLLDPKVESFFAHQIPVLNKLYKAVNDRESSSDDGGEMNLYELHTLLEKSQLFTTVRFLRFLAIFDIFAYTSSLILYIFMLVQCMYRVD
jgi:hypothetical protein